MIQNFNVRACDIDGVFLITPFFIEDQRGYFVKNFNKSIYKATGFNTDINEEFENYSLHNVIRGLHFQNKYPQGKIVRAINGEIYDVIVDLRKDSKTFGQWRYFLLSDKDKLSLIIPKGCAHGFVVLSDSALISYMCTGKYHFEHDSGIIWNDKTLSISWPIDRQFDPIVSEKDSNLQTFEHFMKTHGGF